jgi:phosphatidylglycerophosphate synthase
MSIVNEVPRLAWRYSAGRLWGWIMQCNDNRLVRLIPNLLTLSRFAVVITGVASYRAFIAGHMSAAWLWFVATILVFGLTDYLDGKSARSLKVITNFGKLVDPITDKVAAVTLFVLFSMAVSRPEFVSPLLSTATLLAVIMITVVETALFAAATMNFRFGRIPGANRWGKHKLSAEIVTLGLAYSLLYLTADGLNPTIAPIVVCIMAVPIIAFGLLSLRGHLEATTTPIPKRP